MLMNRLQLMDWLDENIPDWDGWIREERNINNYWNSYVPMKYDNILEERLGYISIINDVGCFERSIAMYKPIGGGTVLYDVYE